MRMEPGAGLPIQFRLLYRQFLLRVIDLEALSIEADIPRFLGQFAGILIMVSLMKGVGTIWFPPPPGAALAIEQGQIENVLLVAGLLAVVSWDATFPDRRDVMVLGPLPVRPLTILQAKLAASAALHGIAVVTLNFASSFAYAIVLSPEGWFRFLVAEWITIVASALLLYGSVLTMQGMTALLLPRRMFLRVSAALQLGTYALVLGTFFLIPTVATWAELQLPENGRLAAWAPEFWLLGLFHQINGTLPDAFGGLAQRAWIALGVVIAGALASLGLCYLRTMKKTVEEPDLVPGARGLHWTPRFGNALQSAIVLFSMRSLARSRQHRVIFAFYLSVVFAITLSWMRAEMADRAPEPMGMGFLISTVVILSFAVFGLRSVFALPISLHANWILRVTQLQATEKYIGAARLSLLLLGMLPAWIVAAALSVGFRPRTAVAEHLLALLLLGWVFVEAGMIRFEKVPFTCSFLPGKANVQVVFWASVGLLMVFAFAGARYELLAFEDRGRYASMVAVLVAAALGLWAWNRRRAKQAVLYFEEQPPVVITTLGIAGWRGPAIESEHERSG